MFVDRAVAAAGFDEAARYQITMAANEAVSNAMEHGTPCGGDSFHLAAGVERDSFVFLVRDCGHFEDTAAPAPDPLVERGRGFAFINLLMDDVRLDARPGETVLRLAKRLPGTPPPTGDMAPEAPERNADAVRELLAALAERDPARMRGVVDRGVMFEPLSTPVVRRIPYLGARGLELYIRDLDETWEEFEVTVRELRTEGSYVVVLAHIHARRGSFAADDATGLAFKLRDGKVVWGKAYPTEEQALEAAGLGV
jgi:anti-sigma regulatory factor (Ser/Thr protein kinase)/ketosteroid isomerase-like protein